MRPSTQRFRAGLRPPLICSNETIFFISLILPPAPFPSHINLQRLTISIFALDSLLHSVAKCKMKIKKTQNRPRTECRLSTNGKCLPFVCLAPANKTQIKCKCRKKKTSDGKLKTTKQIKKRTAHQPASAQHTTYTAHTSDN